MAHSVTQHRNRSLGEGQTSRRQQGKADKARELGLRRQHVPNLVRLLNATDRLRCKADQWNARLADAFTAPTDPRPTPQEPHRLPLSDLRRLRCELDLAAKPLADQVERVLATLEASGEAVSGP